MTLKRTGFKRPQLERIKPNYARLTVKVNQARISGDVVACPKEDVQRSEKYRRLVAAMPCIACGCGPSQAAHPNAGKGMAMKTDDRLCFPLCGPQPGRPGCHALFDQGAMFSKAARRSIETAWGADTRRRILANGQWPERLPKIEPI